MTRSRSMPVRVGAASAARAVSFQGPTAASRVSARSRARRVVSIAVALMALAGALAASAQASLLSPTGSFGSPGSGPGQFQSPQGVAVQASSGNVFVADSQNGRIEKFSPTGSFIAAFGQGQLSFPSTIATDNLGKVYVGDAGTNTVKKFDANGRFLATIDGSTTPQGAFQRLVGVAVDQAGNLWTADGNTNNVDQFDTKGKFLRQWNDTHGSPSAIAVDSARNAVYLITQGSAIERWSLTGNYLAQIELPTFFGSEGFGGPSPSALALDRGTGNLYVDHNGTKADVTVYNPAGIKLDDLSLGSKTNSQGLAFASLQGGPAKPLQQRLYLSDTGDNNVTIYSPRTSPGPPLVTSESVSQRGRTTATLGAGIVPLGSNTTCQFQYVKDAEFRASGFNNATNAACAPAGLGSSFTYQAATASISGLTLGAFYHFRVVATNSAGTTAGDEQEFQAGPGAWAPFNRCPVDDPAMLAADGSSTFGLCLSSNSTHGSIKIGNLPMATTGNTNLQAGLVGPDAFQLEVISPPGGALVSDPVDIPNTPVGTVTAVTQSAGTPSDFNLFAGISTGVPIITLPIKIQLQNPVLGPSCFIGSDQDPIVLHPENTDLSNAESIGGFFTFDPDGTPNLAGLDGSLQITGGVQGDDTFAVPGAHGCGPNGDGSLDPVVNAVVGLPSSSGSNHLVLDDAASGLGFTASFITGQGTRTGQQYAADWHVGFGP